MAIRAPPGTSVPVAVDNVKVGREPWSMPFGSFTFLRQPCIPNLRVRLITLIFHSLRAQSDIGDRALEPQALRSFLFPGGRAK